jgi:hypothetical protein
VISLLILPAFRGRTLRRSEGNVGYSRPLVVTKRQDEAEVSLGSPEEKIMRRSLNETTPKVDAYKHVCGKSAAIDIAPFALIEHAREFTRLLHGV